MDKLTRCKVYKRTTGLFSFYDTTEMYPILRGEYLSWDQAYRAAQRWEARLDR